MVEGVFVRSRGPRRLVACAVLGVLVTAFVASPVAAAGKPGYPDRISWGGASWQVKTSRSAVGPGPNVFAKANVSVDDSDALHLRVQKDASGKWTCAEIIGPTSFGYGTYTFTLASGVDDLDPNLVLGLFMWSDKAPQAHREIDIEFARWGNAADPTNAQYVLQPYGTANHLARFTQPAIASSTQSFTWHPGRIDWVSRDAAGNLIASYSYAGSDVPTPGDERVHLNFWLFNGAAPINGQSDEVVVSSFRFTP
jgi:hypothetical protein